jgi:hypothetical protein
MAKLVRVVVTALAVVGAPLVASLVENPLPPRAHDISGLRLRGSIAFNSDFRLRGSIR